MWNRSPGLAVALLVASASLALVPSAAAHTGTTHAGTPHWVLLGLTVAGLAVVIGAAMAIERGRLSTRLGVPTLLIAVLFAGIGAIGLVEIQVVATTGPTMNHLFPIASLLVGTSVLAGSLLVTRVYWPDRPRYAALGALLGAWIIYPVAFQNEGIRHPLGYALVLALPLTVGYILRKDTAAVLRSVFASRFGRTVGIVTAAITTVVVAFSAGTMTVAPDAGINAPTEGFVRAFPVADPLVTWPAIEFFVPWIPLGGMLSVGTAILFGILGGLVGLNAAVIATQWQAGLSSSMGSSLLGSVMTTGATACCCCAPAMYGVLSAILGTAATPVYWAFMDTSSPLSTAFLAASVLLLTASLVATREGPPGTDEDLAASVSL